MRVSSDCFIASPPRSGERVACSWITFYRFSPATIVLDKILTEQTTPEKSKSAMMVHRFLPT
jgi:hypothetical protein